jgi:hypothetical protein
MAVLARLHPELASQLRSAQALSLLQDGKSSTELLPTGWPDLDAVLPEHGIGHGVIELSAPRGLGGGTTIAMAIVRALHAKVAGSWGAWVETPRMSLYAPALAQAQIDLKRLLIVRPPPQDARRSAVKLVSSGAFDVVVIDLFDTQRNDELFVRKLALAKTRVVLLTDSYCARRMAWPTSLRLELTRHIDGISVRVAKERYGRVGAARFLNTAASPLQS